MAQQKQRKSRRSSGNKSVINKAKEKRRQAKFTKKREEGREYEYKPNLYKKGTAEYQHEKNLRAEKNVDQKTPVARMTSIMRKLNNWLAEQEKLHKDKKVNSDKRKEAES